MERVFIAQQRRYRDRHGRAEEESLLERARHPVRGREAAQKEREDERDFRRDAPIAPLAEVVRVSETQRDQERREGGDEDPGAEAGGEENAEGADQGDQRVGAHAAYKRAIRSP